MAMSFINSKFIKWIPGYTCPRDNLSNLDTSVNWNVEFEDAQQVWRHTKGLANLGTRTGPPCSGSDDLVRVADVGRTVGQISKFRGTAAYVS